MPRVEWLLVCATLLFGSPARAQATGGDIATAQALFDEGKRQMQAGHLDEACPKLVESQRLDPGGGTLLAIALCHEAQGRPATAWGEFSVALSEARKDHRADRESAALDHIRALEQKMPRARIVVETRVDGLEILRDGGPVGQAQWATPLPIDPGEHRFEARAPGKKPWTGTIAIADAPKTTDVTVPPLEDAPPVVSPPPLRS